MVPKSLEDSGQGSLPLVSWSGAMTFGCGPPNETGGDHCPAGRNGVMFQTTPARIGGGFLFGVSPGGIVRKHTAWPYAEWSPSWSKVTPPSVASWLSWSSWGRVELGGGPGEREGLERFYAFPPPPPPLGKAI